MQLCQAEELQIAPLGTTPTTITNTKAFHLHIHTYITSSSAITTLVILKLNQ